MTYMTVNGCRLWVDNSLILDQWTSLCTKDASGDCNERRSKEPEATALFLTANALYSRHPHVCMHAHTRMRA